MWASSSSRVGGAPPPRRQYSLPHMLASSPTPAKLLLPHAGGGSSFPHAGGGKMTQRTVQYGRPMGLCFGRTEVSRNKTIRVLGVML
jgi:hypothetical protein